MGATPSASLEPELASLRPREGAEAQAKGLMITREEVERLQRAGAEKIAAERGR